MPTQEKFVNQAYLSVTEPTINTLTFSKLETGISIYEKVGWLISRIDYFVSISESRFAAAGDNLDYGICSSDQLSDVNLKNNAVVDYNNFRRFDAGTAGNMILLEKPQVKEFSSLPGGGLLVPPNPIYIFCRGVGLPLVMTVEARMFYTVIQLKAEEFWELVEQRRMIGG